MGWFGRVLRLVVGRVASRGAAAAGARRLRPRPRRTRTSPGRPQPVIKKSKSFGLDAGAFLPISREEIIGTATQGRNLFANPWFGRRDQIPPVSDCAHRAHRPGDGDAGADQLRKSWPRFTASARRWSGSGRALRGRSIRLRLRAAAAVEAENEARLRLKALKKEEAARRREERQAAIAHRRATDIVFLGRGVSAQLHDRQSDLDRLAAAGLPALSTPAELAEALGLSIPRLRWLAFHSEAATVSHYIRFTIPKRSGGTRTLATPHRTLAQCPALDFDRDRLEAAGGIACTWFCNGAQHPDECSRARGSGDRGEPGFERFLPEHRVSAGAAGFQGRGVFAGGGDDSGASLHGVPATGARVRRRAVFRGDRAARVTARGVHEPGAFEPGGEAAGSSSGRAGRQAGN